MDLMNFKRFKRIMDTIQKFDKKKEKIDKFFEKELMEDSYCMITLGDDLQRTLINVLADEFDCWFGTRSNKPTHWWNNKNTYGSSNEIEWWLYESDETKLIEVNEKEYHVDTLEKFYDYLMEMYYDRKSRGIEVEFSDKPEHTVSDDERIEAIKSLYSANI